MELMIMARVDMRAGEQEVNTQPGITRHEPIHKHRGSKAAVNFRSSSVVFCFYLFGFSRRSRRAKCKCYKSSACVAY